MHRLVTALAASALLLTACGSGNADKADSPTASASTSTPATSMTATATPSPSAITSAPQKPSEKDRLKKAVKAYSDAFLTGDMKAYDLLSKRCRDRTDRNYFLGILTAANTQYGSALPLKSFDAKINDDMARVTYTYDVSAINQTDEPWVREGGAWHEDDC